MTCWKSAWSFQVLTIAFALATLAFAGSTLGQSYENFSWVVKRNNSVVMENPSIFINEDDLRGDLSIQVFNDQSEAMWVHTRMTLNSSPGGNIMHSTNSAVIEPDDSDTRVGVITYEVPENSEEVAYTLIYTVYLSPHQDPNESPLDHIPVKSGSFVFQRLGGGGGGD